MHQSILSPPPPVTILTILTNPEFLHPRGNVARCCQIVTLCLNLLLKEVESSLNSPTLILQRNKKWNIVLTLFPLPLWPTAVSVNFFFTGQDNIMQSIIEKNKDMDCFVTFVLLLCYFSSSAATRACGGQRAHVEGA